MTADIAHRNTAINLRKEDHLSMAHRAQMGVQAKDCRFDYEPLFSGHTSELPAVQLAGFSFHFPLWISSMTGGAQHALRLNTVMARACKHFSMGMGLGSCRPLLEDRQSYRDFAMREHIGDRPLFANLGIAQIEEALEAQNVARIHKMVAELKADGLVIHVNPLQEWFQPEGNRYRRPALETIKAFFEQTPYPLIVKEVGHGFGPRSLRALMEIPLAAIEFGAFGGTNFSLLESQRANHQYPAELTRVGHTPEEMVLSIKKILAEGGQFKCERFIISGGIQNSLQGYALCSQLPGRAIFGMAHAVLAQAELGEETLFSFLEKQKEQYQIASAFLRPKEDMRL